MKTKFDNVMRNIKRLFGIYEPGYEYWVNRKDIIVNPQWRTTRIGKKKFGRKMRYWYSTGTFESRIILDRDFHLLDGYSSVVIAELKGIERVPVYFR